MSLVDKKTPRTAEKQAMTAKRNSEHQDVKINVYRISALDTKVRACHAAARAQHTAL
jgi:hypothetical protein